MYSTFAESICDLATALWHAGVEWLSGQHIEKKKPNTRTDLQCMLATDEFGSDANSPCMPVPASWCSYLALVEGRNEGGTHTTMHSRCAFMIYPGHTQDQQAIRNASGLHDLVVQRVLCNQGLVHCSFGLLAECWSVPALMPVTSFSLESPAPACGHRRRASCSCTLAPHHGKRV
jgi:hypothetical protein